MLTIEPTGLFRWAFPALFVCICAIWPFGGRRRRAGPEQEEVEGSDEAGENKTDYVDWGIRLATLGEMDRAAEEFKRALQQDESDAAAHYNLGLALDEMGQHAEAGEHYARAAQIAPDSQDIEVNLGVSLLMLGDHRSAIKHLEQAARSDADDPLPHFDLGCAHLRNGGFKKAVSSFREAVKADPKDPQVRFNLAVALRKAGCADLAENELRDFLALAGSRFPEHRRFVESLLAREYQDDQAD